MLDRYTLAGLLSVLAIGAVIALAVLAGAPDKPAPQASATAVPTLPPERTSELQKAAEAAGCTLEDPPNEGAQHVAQAVSPANYGVNPPTSGVHSPEWAPDGVYGPGDTPALGTLVHTLEHGRINLQYKPGTPTSTIHRLAALYRELDDGYHLLLYENRTGMPYAVAATAWDHLLGCPRFNDRVPDAIRAFRAAYIDKGPEKVP